MEGALFCLILLFLTVLSGVVTRIIPKLPLPIHSKISLLGMPAATLSSQGLQWELHQEQLSFPGTTSCFNRTRLPEISLAVHQGAVLVLIYEQAISDAGLTADKQA